VSNSDHNMHMDNPVEFANIIINDIMDENLPIGIMPQEENEIDFESEFYDNMD